jgi:DNA-binding XRE family transcriptional regulator
MMRAYRMKYDITVRVMAEMIGVSPATISRLEHERPIDTKTMLKLIGWLFGSAT